LKKFAKFSICCGLSVCGLFVLEAQPKTAAVPFVGCESDGQSGPKPTPRGGSKAESTDKASAERLAYYSSGEGFGVLAPRGWYCFGAYGSNGQFLFVSPRPIARAPSWADWPGFTGDVVQLSWNYGGTSGRYVVAEVIARVFPAHRQFLTDLRHDPLQKDFHFGPFPTDALTYKSNSMVEYVAPPWKDGLGTVSPLKKNDTAIHGVAMLFGEAPDLLQLSMRLPAALSSLDTVIIQRVELDFARHAER